MGSLHTSAADLSTTNRASLQHFFDAVDPPKRPVTILSFGDSMADSYRSIGFALMNQFSARMGVSGYAFNNYANALLYNLTNGAQALGPSSLWYSTHYQVPATGAVWWTKENSNAGILSDNVGVFYVAQPNGGVFSISVSTNAGPWGTLLTVDGYSEVPVGRFTNISLNLQFHRLRIDSVAGTNIVLGPQLLNSQSPGINIAFMDYPGISLGEITNVPLSIRTPIMKALAPDLLLWHMKEDGSEGTRLRMIECEQWWSNAVPDLSVVYMGTPYVSLDTHTTWTEEQNTIVRSVAVDYRHTYVDCMTPAVSYPWMLSKGFMVDSTHLNFSGSSYLAGFVWYDLGFFSVRIPRSLTIESLLNECRLSYATALNILYTLESSDDLTNWQPMFSTTGDGNTFTTNLAQTVSRRWYHLRLNPIP
jgi:hypothetical protein